MEQTAPPVKVGPVLSPEWIYPRKLRVNVLGANQHRVHIRYCHDWDLSGETTLLLFAVQAGRMQRVATLLNVTSVEEIALEEGEEYGTA